MRRVRAVDFSVTAVHGRSAGNDVFSGRPAPDIGWGKVFGTGLGRHLPIAWQGALRRVQLPIVTYLLRARLRPLARDASGPADFSGCRVAILGLFRTRIGIGRGADLLARELETEGALVTRIDVTDFLGLPRNRIRDDVTDLGALTAAQFDVIVLHLNPPQFSQLRLRLPFAAIYHSTLVGYFYWELDGVPASWREAVACCNQVWAPSEFVAQAIERSFPEARTKLRVREHRVELEKLPTPTPEARSAARRHLGVRDDAFLVLTSFSVQSTVARKNPVAAVEAFRKAMAAVAAPAELVVRCLDVNAWPGALKPLEQAAGDDPRIHLARIGPESSDIEDAYLAADMYISLHRSEGFGLNLAEALALGMPVLATRWGLSDSIAEHQNFIGVPSRLVPVIDPQHVYDQVPGARWAEADVEFAAAELRKRIDAWLQFPGGKVGAADRPEHRSSKPATQEYGTPA